MSTSNQQTSSVALRDLTILTVMLEWSYGTPAKGPSLDKAGFLPALQALAQRVEPFWYDDYLSNIDTLQRAILEKAQIVKPDLIFFTTYTDQFKFETLDQLRRNYLTAAWFSDDAWRFDSYSAHQAPHYSWAITAEPRAVSRYQRLKVPVILSQFAARADVVVKAPLPPAARFRHDVSFVGLRNDVRSWFVKALERQGISTACYGDGWPDGVVTYPEMDEIFLTSRINLNLSNSVPNDIDYVLRRPRHFARWLIGKKRTDGIKARVFEIPMAGGFELSHYALGLERYFEIGRELAIYANPRECAEQIAYYLDNDDERYAIALRAQKRTMREHTYIAQFDRILTQLFPDRRTRHEPSLSQSAAISDEPSAS